MTEINRILHLAGLKPMKTQELMEDKDKGSSHALYVVRFNNTDIAGSFYSTHKSLGRASTKDLALANLFTNKEEADKVVKRTFPKSTGTTWDVVSVKITLA